MNQISETTKVLILIPAENENISGAKALLTMNSKILCEREVHRPKRGTAMVVLTVMIDAIQVSDNASVETTALEFVDCNSGI